MREFLKRLEEKGEVERIERRVSRRFEASAIAKRSEKTVFFEDLEGKKAVSNLLNKKEKLALALGIPPENLTRYLASPGRGEVRIVEDSPTRERRGSLKDIPALVHYEKDPGYYITAGVLVASYENELNASIHRILILDDRRMVARLVPPRHTYLMHQKASENGDPLPIAVAIGVSPAVLLAASSRVPQNEEFRYASWLSGGELELWEAENGVPVPHAEYVIEGYIHPEERAPEGPFVDITGTYDRVRYEPVIYVERVWMREDPIYHALIPASGEHFVLMGTPYEPMIYSRVSENVEVLDVHLTPGGCSYLHCVVKIRKRTEGDAKNAGIAALSAHPSLKHVVIVDEDIDIYDPRDVEYAIATRVRGDKDIVLIPGSRGSSLDPMADEEGRTTKMIIDATKELKRAEEFERAKIPEV